MVKYPDGGPIPNTSVYLEKLERERESKEKSENKDNRSFVAKYVRLYGALGYGGFVRDKL
jgi:hypothetical protein